MNRNDEEELDYNYDDMEAALDRQEVPEKVARAFRNYGDLYISGEQLNNKGSLLGHYKSRGFLRTYIDVYERAIIGKAEFGGGKKTENFRWGFACLKEAVAEDGALYLNMNDGKIYRIRHLKNAELIAYLINGQNIKIRNGESG